MGKESKGSWFFFIANLLNFILATAIFTIPFPMYEVGIFLGSIILAITCFLSVIACTFIIESLAMKNSIFKRQSSILNYSIKENEEEKDDEKNNEVLMPKKNQENRESEVIKSDPEENYDETKDEFYIFERFEISKLAKTSLNKPGYFFVIITLICYLYIAVTSNSIIAGNNLKDIIGRTFGIKKLPDYYYYIIVSFFYFLTIIIALNNINHLKKFSMFIMIMRFLIIFLIIFCCFYSMIEYGITKFSNIPKFDISNITVMIGNSLFVFMCHHSIPGMVENFTPQKHLIKLLIIGYIFSLLFIIAYSYIGVFAFSNPKFSCKKEDPFPIAIQSTFSSNFLGLPVFGYIINYYPILNVITSGMQLITLRNNIIEAISGCNPTFAQKLNFAEQEGMHALLKNFVFNLIVAIPPIIIGLTLQNIQSLMKYFSSILGFLLMLIVPLLLVTGFRNIFNRREFNYSKLNRSFLKTKVGSSFIIIISKIIFGLIIYGFVKNTQNKSCIYE